MPSFSQSHLFAVTDGTNMTITASADNFQPQDLDGVTFGLVSYLSAHAAPDAPFVYDGSHRFSVSGSDAVDTFRLAEIITELSPDTQPVFSLGSSSLIDPGKAAAVPLDWQLSVYSPPAGLTISDDWDDLSLHQSITVVGFVVVADWNFRHFGASAFVPGVMNNPRWTIPQPDDTWKTNYHRRLPDGTVTNL
jgi:hypothetical protein